MSHHLETWVIMLTLHIALKRKRCLAAGGAVTKDSIKENADWLLEAIDHRLYFRGEVTQG